MKSLSASLIVLAAAGLILGGAVAVHGDTSTFVMATGCIAGTVGLWGWIRTLADR